MTVHASLNYDETIWQNAVRIGRDVALDWQLMADALAQGLQCFQQVVVSADDHYLLCHAMNQFCVTAWDVLVHNSMVPKGRLIVTMTGTLSPELLSEALAAPLRCGDLRAIEFLRSNPQH